MHIKLNALKIENLFQCLIGRVKMPGIGLFVPGYLSFQCLIGRVKIFKEKGVAKPTFSFNAS